MRGGARANSGPDPDPFSIRTAKRLAAAEQVGVGWIVLPSTGRPGDPPSWPLTAATDREALLWARLWAKPQATQWEPLGVDLEVALYVRRLVEVEQPGASAALGSLLLRMEEGLGLSIPGLQARKWQIGSPDGPPAPVLPIRDSDRSLTRDRWGSGTARDRIKRMRTEQEEKE